MSKARGKSGRFGGVGRFWGERITGSSSQRSKRPANSHRYGLEQLEPRCLLSAVSPLDSPALLLPSTIIGGVVDTVSLGSQSVVSPATVVAQHPVAAIVEANLSPLLAETRDRIAAIVATDPTADLHALTSTSVAVDSAGRLYVSVVHTDLYCGGIQDDTLQQLRSAGLQVEDINPSAKTGVCGWVSYTMLHQLTTVSGVLRIEPIIPVSDESLAAASIMTPVLQPWVSAIRDSIKAVIPAPELFKPGIPWPQEPTGGSFQILVPLDGLDESTLQQLETMSYLDLEVPITAFRDAASANTASESIVITIHRVNVKEKVAEAEVSILVLCDSSAVEKVFDAYRRTDSYDYTPPPTEGVSPEVTDLLDRIEAAVAADPAADLSKFGSTTAGGVDSVGRMEIYVNVDKVTDNMLQTLESAGLTVDGSSVELRAVHGWASYRTIDEIIVIPGIIRVGRGLMEPFKSVTNGIIGSTIRDMQRQIEARLSAGSGRLSELSRPGGTEVNDSGEIYVHVGVAGFTETTLDDLRAAGMKVLRDTDMAELYKDTWDNSCGVSVHDVQGWVPYSSIDQLVAVSGVTELYDLPMAICNTGDVTSAGDSVLRTTSFGRRSPALTVQGLELA